MVDTIRFEDKYIPEPNTGCWLWIGSISSNGYGNFWLNKKSISAHFFSYKLFGGRDLFENEIIHHKCRQKSCVNPRHLEITTLSKHPGAGPVINREKSICINGHLLIEGNLYFSSRGDRLCKACRRINSKKYRLKNEEKVKTYRKEYGQKNKKKISEYNQLYRESRRRDFRWID